MKKIIQTFLLALLIQAPLLFSQNIESSLIDEIFKDWDKRETPGAAVGIIKEGSLIFSKGYGMADLEHDIVITPSSVFYIGSVSKQFVTFCILLLEEQGKINLDDEIQVYLPDFPRYDAPLTVRNFIHHTSGVRDYLTLMFLKGRNYLDHTEPEEVYDLIKRQKELNFTPGEKYLYSNSCYFMLALIVEKVAGESIRDFAEKNIFDPLGMKHTLFYDDITDLIKNKVFSYYRSDDGEGYDNLVSRFDLVGSGGVYSTIQDLYLWDQNFYHNILGKGGQDIINKMHEEGILNNGESSGYAFALNNGKYKGLRTVSHGGALAGYRAELMRFPDQEFSVIILANRGDAAPTRLAYAIADIYLEDQFVIEEKSESEVISADTKEDMDIEYKLDQIIGSYQIQPGIVAKVSLENENLKVHQLWNNSQYEIKRESGNTFEIPGDSTIQFIFSNLTDEMTQELKVYQNNIVTEAKRIEEGDIEDYNLDDYVGEYYGYEIDATYEIFLDHDTLKVKVAGKEEYELNLVSKHEAVFEGGNIRFELEDAMCVGFRLDAGRVQNLKFERK